MNEWLPIQIQVPVERIAEFHTMFGRWLKETRDLPTINVAGANEVDDRLPWLRTNDRIFDSISRAEELRGYFPVSSGCT